MNSTFTLPQVVSYHHELFFKSQNKTFVKCWKLVIIDANRKRQKKNSNRNVKGEGGVNDERIVSFG